MKPSGLDDLYILPMPSLDSPSWIATEWTPPKHRIRYRFWSLAANVTERIEDLFERMFNAADERMSACGPRPIIDESKLPTSVSFSWTDKERDS